MRSTILTACAVLGAGVAVSHSPLPAQSVAERTPNLSGGWIAERGVIQFNFVHRFELSDPPLRKLTNVPTFHVMTGLGRSIMAGFAYAPNSQVVAGIPNEWELLARARPWAQRSGAAADVALQTGYNVATLSFDNELQVARQFGPVRALAAGRVFVGGDSTWFAAAAGVVVRVSPAVAIAGDIASRSTREQGEGVAWSAGLQLGVPYTPHSFSIHATNVNSVTLQGTTRATRTRVGFEYTVPITLARYRPPQAEHRLTASDRRQAGILRGTVRPFATPSAGRSRLRAEHVAAAFSRAAFLEATDPAAPAGSDTVRVMIRSLKFGSSPLQVATGTTVVWVNEDVVAHSVTSEDSTFDSGLIQPGARWARVFARAGTFSYACTPHPFMRGRVVVMAHRGAGENPR